MISEFSQILLEWYDKNRREMPWRNTRDPYKIWLSEIMLQQTQVQTVIPYYEKWIHRFPSLETVAKANEQDLLKQWEGLGYYSRCRNFHHAAKMVMETMGGRIPEDWKTFRSLPGVGDYTASAVLSIVYGVPVPAIDGNVKRVMARVLARRKLDRRGEAYIHSRLIKWIHPDRPGDFNQALMDLGSRVCRSNQAHCFECPVTDFCLGYQRGRPEGYPVRLKGKPIPHRHIVAGIIWKKDKFLITQRAASGLLGGLWEFPGGKVESGETAIQALQREIKEECGLTVQVKNRVGAVRHAYSHFSITMELYHCQVLNPGRVVNSGSYAWIRKNDRHRYPFPKANHKLFALLDEQDWTMK